MNRDMRIEVVLPDSTKPELQARIQLLLERLSARPELVEEIPASDAEAIEASLSESQYREIDSALAEARAGRFVTLRDLERRLLEREHAWVSKNTP